jgi:hypothetical protein
MWDFCFRIGATKFSSLDLDTCAKQLATVNEDCIAASLLLHMTPQSSGYFEAIWVGWPTTTLTVAQSRHKSMCMVHAVSWSSRKDLPGCMAQRRSIRSCTNISCPRPRTSFLVICRRRRRTSRTFQLLRTLSPTRFPTQALERVCRLWILAVQWHGPLEFCLLRTSSSAKLVCIASSTNTPIAIY